MLMKLIDQTTQQEIKIGDTVTDFRGEKHILKDMKEPKEEWKSGYVYLASVDEPEVMISPRQYYATVINAKFIEE